ncbi:MAG: acyl-CoA thioesterase [Actinophytocola sp.]|uniref:acyl-CoA thioesterase n=1 Tax=Actinophytocola sp. TaxID=1872138 RepID=UPI003D6B2D3E
MTDQLTKAAVSPETRRRRAEYPVIRTVPTRWADHDTYGHVNNAVHYVLMDSAINGWLLDASQVDIRKLPAMGVVVETSCRYFKEVHFPQEVHIGIALERSGNTSVRYDVALFTDDETPVAVARFVHVYVDRHTRRPVPIPPEIHQALHQLRATRNVS